ncbi:response regulator [Sulfurimonas aquatica]|uniref:Response regulator n=1 Tax=Sulfurimonas aquatica TaxID=2672570 RepID=A0A975B0I0_9BACT|nr:response regulator [Sulfurimonas aquatica]QSZ41986.1 response regulator [Sulfurimonas aquatica]
MKIIILDDSATIRMIIEAHLEDLGVNENEIFSFENGFKALEFIYMNGADIVFTDINMPGLNGYEFAQMLYIRFPRLKNAMFAISGDENKESYMKMKEIGIHRFLKKPINAEHFEHFMKPEILKRKAAEKESQN